MSKYVSFIINRRHFGGGGAVKGILLFPISSSKEIPKLVERMSSIFCTYLSEFNRNEVSEYDDRCRELSEIVFEADQNIDELRKMLAYIRHDIGEAKIIYVAKHNDYDIRKEVMFMSHYSFELNIAPNVRDKYPDGVFTMILTKSFNGDREFIDELKSLDLGVYKFSSNIIL